MNNYTAEQLAAIVSRIRQDIDNYCIELFRQEPREHLGASEIGEECQRRIWYGWRWVVRRVFAPRMLRLFNRGHNTEGRCTEFLRAAGFEVFDTDPNTGKQYLFSDIEGHYGGSTDGLATHPQYFPGQWLQCEYKTHNDKSFQLLLKEGVRRSKPRHYVQMSTYGRRFGCHFGIYVAVNKDNDNIHIEILELDWTLADEKTEAARTIITSQVPLKRMNNAQPSFFACKQCEALGVCFYNQRPEKNCRSCSSAQPAPNGQWFCSNFGQMIPPDFIRKGCEQYRSIV